MRVFAKRFVLLWICFFFLLSSNSIGQMFRSVAAVGNEEGGDSGFRVSEAVHVSLSGLKRVTSFSIADENGINYDTMSLLRMERVRKLADVSDETFRELYRDYAEVVEEMKSQVVSATFSSQGNDELREMFRAMDLGLQEKLGPEQLAAIENARHQHAYERLGLKHFASKDAIEKYGISEKLADLLRDANTQSELEKCLSSAGKELNSKANATLLKELTDGQQEKVKRLWDKQSSKRYHETDLFIGSQVSKARKKAFARQMLKKLCSHTVRKSLKATDEQTEKIGQIRVTQHDISDEDIDAQLGELLSEEQTKKLAAAILQRDLAKVGTVNALSYGTLGQWLELTESESDQIFDAGERIFKKVKAETESKLADSLNDIFDADDSAEELSANLVEMLSGERLIKQ